MEGNTINNDQQRWVPLESNSDIFTNYFQGIGLSNDLYFEELISFDYQNIQCNINKQTEIVIAIFNKSKPNSLIYNEKCFTAETDVQFYMIQNDALTNACGLVAGLQGIGNLERNMIKSGSLLDQFFAQKKSSEEYAIGLSTNKDLKDYHLKAAIKGSSAIPQNPKDVIHHYVTFIYNPNDSFIYELDGRLGKPYCHKTISDKESLLDNVIQIINGRLEADLIRETISLLILLRKKNNIN